MSLRLDEEEADWAEVIRVPSPRNPFQKKTRVQIRRRQKEDKGYILCLSEGRDEKDRAIREKQQERLINYLERLKRGIEKRHLKMAELIHQRLVDCRSAIRALRTITRSNTNGNPRLFPGKRTWSRKRLPRNWVAAMSCEWTDRI